MRFKMKHPFQIAFDQGLNAKDTDPCPYDEVTENDLYNAWLDGFELRMENEFLEDAAQEWYDFNWYDFNPDC